SVTDATVSGGTRYAYVVTGSAAGSCPSGPSSCAEVTATGSCILPPSFAGLAAAANPGAATSGLVLSWTPAAGNRAGPLAYPVSRWTEPGFVPGLANLLATVAGTSFRDDAGLASDVNYTYVVRAVDAGNGAEDGNLARATAAPSGAISWSETFEGAGGFDH